MLSFGSAPSTLLLILVSILLFPGALAGNTFKPSFSYGSNKVRGVNLGGWLVLESWLTPSLFDDTGNTKIVDEWTFCKLQPRAVAHSKLLAHWETWITEQDFSDIAAAGLNHVRIPIGFWAWDVSGGEPYIQGSLTYLRKAVVWARIHKIKVIIDLHGAPGSQNAFPHSGHRVSAPAWHTSAKNVQRTNTVIKKIMAEFGPQNDVVSVVSPLNEPKGTYSKQLLDTTRQYWRDSYGNIRYPYGTSKQSNTLMLIDTAFKGLKYWDSFMPPAQYPGVAIDLHTYQMFEDLAFSDAQHVASACAQGAALARAPHMVVVGEWTPATTDCALNYDRARGTGARYDGTAPGSRRLGSCAGKSGRVADISAAYARTLRQMYEAQTSAFERGAGWVMWTWKTEKAADWSYQAGLQGGWIPQDPTERQYPNMCS